MKRLLLISLVMLVAASAAAHDIEEGRLRLKLHEDTARFSLAVRAGSAWIPLLFPDDPRTTALDILEDNRIHRIGDSGNFRQIVEHSSHEPRFVWTSPTLRIEQSFRFTRGVNAISTDAVHMVVTVTNLSEEPSRVGVRIIYDTYLGEGERAHFTASNGHRYDGESRLKPGPRARYVTSAPGLDADYGFQIMLYGVGVTPPAGVVLANWKRLSDSAWDYDVDEHRDFSRPYYGEDSAVMTVYEPGFLAPGDRYTVATFVGNLAPDGYLDPLAAAASNETDRLLDRIARLVARIDELLGAPDVGPDEVAELQLELEILSNSVRGR